jgi:hypothetical protein
VEHGFQSFVLKHDDKMQEPEIKIQIFFFKFTQKKIRDSKSLLVHVHLFLQMYDQKLSEHTESSISLLLLLQKIFEIVDSFLTRDNNIQQHTMKQRHLNTK